MKKVISLVLAISMVFSLFVSAFAATTYPDLVEDNAKFAVAVDALTILKVINGFPDGEFKPGNEVTRAELAKMLVICLGLNDQVEALATKTMFSDVAGNHWAAGYINAAAQSKIIIGYPDGTFKPEKNVSYAEAFTMALRALGYGNVVEAEGTWPTAYMLKAVELELTDDMENVTSSAAALRGNTAILLWNMLRRPMWRITEESQANGMTLSDKNERIMLNVKFPDYTYREDVKIEQINVTDNEDVKVKVTGVGEAKVENMDLSRLIIGEEVTVLIKDYKDSKKATFLTIVPENTIVEGFITEKAADSQGRVIITVNDTEYRFEKGAKVGYEPNTYVVLEAEGKNINVINELPTEGTYATTLNKIKSDIDDEDALVIIDGEWATRDDVEIGMVYTELQASTGTYWMVNSSSDTANFEQLFKDTEKWDGVKKDVWFLSLDDEDVRVVRGNLKAWKGEDNKTSVSLDALEEKPKNNDYSDNEVEVFSNYLGIPVVLHFGDVETNGASNFYAVISNGAPSEGSLKGKVYTMELADSEGATEEYQTVVNASVPEFLKDNESVYSRETPTYIWAKFSDDNEEEIEDIVILANGLKSGDVAKDGGATYKSKYNIIDVSDKKISDKKLDGYTVASSATIFEVSATKNDKDVVDGFECEIATREDYDGITLPEGTLAAVDTTNNRIKFIFVAGDAESDKVLYGKVTAGVRRGNIEINGESYELKDGSLEPAEGDLVGYTLNKDGNKANVKEIFDLKEIDKALVVAHVDSDEKDDEIIAIENGDDLDLEEGQAYKDHKKYNVFVVTLGTEKNSDAITISDVEQKDEQGHKGLAGVNEYDRILIKDAEKAILVFTEFEEDQTTENGNWATRTTTTNPQQQTQPTTSGDAQPAGSGDAQPAGSGDAQPAGSGDAQPAGSGDGQD